MIASLVFLGPVIQMGKKGPIYVHYTRPRIRPLILVCRPDCSFNSEQGIHQLHIHRYDNAYSSVLCPYIASIGPLSHVAIDVLQLLTSF